MYLIHRGYADLISNLMTRHRGPIAEQVRATRCGWVGMIEEHSRYLKGHHSYLSFFSLLFTTHNSLLLCTHKFTLAVTQQYSTKMVYKLHGAAVSTCTQRVLITAAEVGVDVELVPVDFSKGEHKSPEHIKHQPFGQVPYLEDTETGKTMHE